MRVVVDENMPLAVPFFQQMSDVVCLPGRHMTASDVKQADILLVRSVTPVNGALLAGSSVRLVGTATIGTDHIDMAAMAEMGIPVLSAPGCNARAVGEYVATVLATLASEQGFEPAQRTLGVVGLGNTGREVLRLARLLGFRVLGCDPFLREAGNAEIELRTLEQLLAEADIFSLHVPLTKSGAHPTHHLWNANTLARLKPQSILINSSRGGVVDNAALLAALSARPDVTAVLDVWEGEPVLMPELLARVRFGTPHIAGYSQEGKWRGTEMLYRGVCDFLQVPAQHKAADFLFNEPLPAAITLPSALSASQTYAHILQQACPLARDDAALRSSVFAANPAAAFDGLRKNYPPRREFSAHCVQLSRSDGTAVSADIAAWVRRLGFRLA